MKDYKKLEDLYEDIKGATLDTLEKNKNKYNLPINQAVAYYMNEMNSIFEENEFERIVTLIPIGVFIVENNYKDSVLLEDIKKSLLFLERKEYYDLFLDKEKDLKDLSEDIKYLKEKI